MVNYKTDGRCKKYIRSEIIKIIDKIRPNIIFTLPNLNFDVESHAVIKKAKVICCEIDKEIFKAQSALGNKGIELYNDKMSNIVSKHIYDLAWLDACGPISRELIESLSNLKLSKNGKLVITVGLAREHKDYKIEGDRLEFYNKLLNSFGYNTYKIYTYRDYKFPMAAFFCSRNKVDNINVYSL